MENIQDAQGRRKLLENRICQIQLAWFVLPFPGMWLPRGNAERLCLDLGSACPGLAAESQIFHKQPESHPRTSKLGRDSSKGFNSFGAEGLTHTLAVHPKQGIRQSCKIKAEEAPLALLSNTSGMSPLEQRSQSTRVRTELLELQDGSCTIPWEELTHSLGIPRAHPLCELTVPGSALR